MTGRSEVARPARMTGPEVARSSHVR